MFEGYCAEQVIRQREGARAQRLALQRLNRDGGLVRERAVLCADLGGWSLRRAGAVIGMAAMALVVSVAVPASLQGLAWSLREILEVISR